jgi:RNA-directed DNA polymerase
MAKNQHTHFSFLGFTFYWGKQGRRRILKVKTQKERLIRSLQEFEQWIKKIRNQKPLKSIWELAKSKIRGHLNYYGFRMNALKLNHFYWEAIRSLFKWLNRRSQKRSYNWEGFTERLKYFPLMIPLADMKLKQLGWNPDE